MQGRVILPEETASLSKKRGGVLGSEHPSSRKGAQQPLQIHVQGEAAEKWENTYWGVGGGEDVPEQDPQHKGED